MVAVRKSFDPSSRFLSFRYRSFRCCSPGGRRCRQRPVARIFTFRIIRSLRIVTRGHNDDRSVVGFLKAVGVVCCGWCVAGGDGGAVVVVVAVVGFLCFTADLLADITAIVRTFGFVTAAGKKFEISWRELCRLADAVDVDENVSFSVDVYADRALG